MIKIGNISLDVSFYQAPLSGYSDMPMRTLARHFGCPLTYTGVLLDKIALHPKAIRKLKFLPGEEEHPIGAQILGADPKTMAAAAKSFVDVGYDAIDLNCACPAPKVLRRQRGGYLMNEPDKVIEMLKRTKDAVDCPVTIKLRIGWDSSQECTDKFREICERSAAEKPDAITIHGRTVHSKYRGKSNWDILTQVKATLPGTTIFGSGDLMTPEAVIERVKNSRLDGVCIARGAIGNPWIFRDARALLEGKEMPEEPTLKEQCEIMLWHFEMILQIMPQRKAVPYFRKFAARYCHRHPQRKNAQLDIMSAKKKEAVVDTIKKHFEC